MAALWAIHIVVKQMHLQLIKNNAIMDKLELEKLIDETWAELIATNDNVYRSMSGVNPNLMVMSADGTISFMVRFGNSIKPDITKKKYANVSISLEHITSAIDAIVVTLNESRFRNTFKVIATDIIYAAMLMTNEKDMVNIFCNKLNTWSYIFKAGIDNKLSEEEQVGLYGELTFIKKLLEETQIAESAIVEAWVGPNGEDKDFQYCNYAVEIKSSLNMANQLKIANLKQLDGTGLTALYLYHFAFAKTEGGPNTLSALIEELRNALSSSPVADIFEDKLISVGYLDEDKERYTRSYVIQNESAYLVDITFPKIISSMVPGVINAEYTIDLNGCISNMISDQVILQNLENA